MEYLRKLIPMLISSIILFLSYQVWFMIDQKKEVLKINQSIPKFSFLTLEQEVFDQACFIEDKPVIFIFFNSECYSCQEQAIDIYNSNENLTQVQVIFISTEQPEQIKNFAEQFGLQGLDNISFLFDERNDFTTTFGVTSVPFILIYNDKHELVGKWKGQTKVSVILDDLNTI